MMKNDLQSVQRVYPLLIDFFVNKSFHILVAILILAAGYFVSTWVSRLIIKLFERKNMDITLRQLIGNICDTLRRHPVITGVIFPSSQYTSTSFTIRT